MPNNRIFPKGDHTALIARYQKKMAAVNFQRYNSSNKYSWTEALVSLPI